MMSLKTLATASIRSSVTSKSSLFTLFTAPFKLPATSTDRVSNRSALSAVRFCAVSSFDCRKREAKLLSVYAVMKCLNGSGIQWIQLFKLTRFLMFSGSRKSVWTDQHAKITYVQHQTTQQLYFTGVRTYVRTSSDVLHSIYALRTHVHV